MSILTKIKRGPVQGAPLSVLIYGIDGVGKTTFGAQAPKPVFISAEEGTELLDVARFDAITTFRQVEEVVEGLTLENHDFQTLVVDSVDWLEPLIWKDVCDTNSWKSVEDAGFGKGYLAALTLWKTFLGQLDRLKREKKMNIVLIGHSELKTFHDPNHLESYDRYQLKLNAKASALLREWVSSVLFSAFHVAVSKDKNAPKAKAFSNGDRLIYTTRTPAYDAKNRFSLPEELPLSWLEFETAARRLEVDPKGLADECLKLIEGEKVEKTRTRMTEAVRAAGADTNTLLKLKKSIEKRIN